MSVKHLTIMTIMAMTMVKGTGFGVPAQDPTVGLIHQSDGSYPGYTLFAPLPFTVTYLIDHQGLLINSWESSLSPGNAAYLLDDGSLLRAAALGTHPIFQSGGSGGAMQRFDWNDNLVWNFRYSSQTFHAHHDMEALPNGNILMIAWEYKSAAEAVAAGRSPQLLPQGELWPDHVVEICPSGLDHGDVVWEWHIWDHLIQDLDPSKDNYGIVADHPELVDINYVMNDGPNAGHPDWNHTNGIDYNEDLDQIVLSVRAFSEIWVIDHSTTAQEASGHSGGNSGAGGDLLYRWGNPEAYRAGTAADRKFFCQHDAQWIPSGLPGQGNILVFNNGSGRPEGEFSTVDEIIPPVDENGLYDHTPGSSYGPEEQTWIYRATDPFDFYSSAISGAERMPNGNTLICSGNWGTLFEVTPDGETVWLYVNPVTGDGPLYQGESVPENPGGQGTLNMVFKARRYASAFQGFEGHDLIPGDPVELYPASVKPQGVLSTVPISIESIYPNPCFHGATIQYSISEPITGRWSICTVDGREIWSSAVHVGATGSQRIVWDGIQSNGVSAPSGTYIVRLTIAEEAKHSYPHDGIIQMVR